MMEIPKIGIGKTTILDRQDTALILIYLLAASIVVPIATQATLPTAHAYYRELIETVDEVLWTPMFFAHAPRYGHTTAAEEWSFSSEFSIGPVGSHSSISSSWSATASDGACGVLCRKCLWEWQRWYCWDYDEFGNYIDWYECEWMITQSYADVVYRLFYGSSADTCADDLSQISWAGLNSVTWNTKFEATDFNVDNTHPTDPIQCTERTGWLQAFSADLSTSVNVRGNVGVGTNSIFNLVWNWGQTFDYTYHFGPNHGWHVDQNGGTPHLWAFTVYW